MEPLHPSREVHDIAIFIASAPRCGTFSSPLTGNVAAALAEVRFADPWMAIQTAALLAMACSAALDCHPATAGILPQGWKAVVAFLGWIASLSYLRGFEATSAFVKMLLEAMMDITGFVPVSAGVSHALCWKSVKFGEDSGETQGDLDDIRGIS